MISASVCLGHLEGRVVAVSATGALATLSWFQKGLTVPGPIPVAFPVLAPDVSPGRRCLALPCPTLPLPPTKPGWEPLVLQEALSCSQMSL